VLVFWNWYEKKIDRRCKTGGRCQKICAHRETLQAESKVERCPRRSERRHPLRGHVRADGDMRRQITQDREIILPHRCLRLRPRFPAKNDHTRWQAATVGTLRIEPLADSVTERWVTEDCPGRLLADDCRSRATRQGQGTKAGGAQCRILRGNAPKNFSPLPTPACASWSNSGGSVVEQRQRCRPDRASQRVESAHGV
jgi:hypothetical protein